MRSVALVVIGGGITGVSVARLLDLRGMRDVVVLEAEDEAGGLCRSKRVNGHVLDIGGGHFLCSKYPEVYDFLFAHFPKDALTHVDRVSKIRLGAHVIDYPIEYNLWQLPQDMAVEYLLSCLRAGEVGGGGAPTSFREWVRWKLGERIADDYMIPYNRKIWGVDPDELDIDWLEKIPQHDLKRILGAALARRADTALMPSHQTFYYPKRGGFQALFDALHAPVRDRVQLSTPVTSLRREGKNWIVNETWSAPLVVNTIPWRVLHPTVSGVGAALPSTIDAALERLQTSALVVTLHEAPYEHDWHWCYDPDPELAHHREFYIHNFAADSARNGFYRETNAKRYADGGGAIFTHRNAHAYPIPVRGHVAAAAAVHAAYAEIGILGVGRWGQHRYYNSDVCIREAMRLVEGLAKGGAEGAAGALAGARSLR